MRFVPTAFVVLSILGGALSTTGCADQAPATYQLAAKRTANGDSAATSSSVTSTPAHTAEAFTVRGTVTDPEMAAKAKTVEVLALAADGTTTPVTTADVQPDGTFTASLTGADSPTGIFITSLLTIGHDIIGSGTVNGALPLAKGVFIDATIDAATSFKTNVLQNIAQGKVPDLQNYINVIEAYVNSQLLNVVFAETGITTDATSLVNATSDSIVAAENVILDTLKKAGVNVDFTQLQSAQATVVKGIDTGIMDAKTITITGGTMLVSGIEGAIKTTVGPIDQLIFNSVSNGGAAFANTMKTSGMPATVAFAASKSSFSLQTALSTSQIKNSFAQTSSSADVTGGLDQACQAFWDAVDGAANVGDLAAARTQFMNVLLGKNTGDNECCLYQLICAAVTDVEKLWTYFDSTIKPWTDELVSAFGSCDYGQIGDALTSFDKNTANWQTSLPGLSGDSAKNFSNAVRLVQKQIPQ